MKISPRRAGRIRDELRLWLRSRHGIRSHYSREEIDRGREDLDFGGPEDALVAYTLFGGNLVPDHLDALNLPISAEDIGEIIDAASSDVVNIAGLLVDD